MLNRFMFSVLFWIMGLFAVFGQADPSFVHVKAKLMNTETKEEIPFAHVIVLSKNMGLTSDEFGCFDADFPQNDSLIISSLGYHEYRTAIKDLKTDSSLNIISLNPKIYLLKEVTITQYPTYEKLIEIITNPVYTENEKHILRANSFLTSIGLKKTESEDFRKRVVSGGPISAVYNLFSREAKNNRKYLTLVNQEQKSSHIFKKINYKTIELLTGLNDSTTIQQFIKFCNISDYTLNNSSDYELYTLILKKIKDFQQKD